MIVHAAGGRGIGNMRVTALILAALAFAAPALMADEDYVVRLTRPKKVGDRYRLDAKGTSRERQRVTVGDRSPQDDEKELSVHLVAEAKVLAVDARLEASRIEYRIESCRKSSSGKTEDVLPAGRTVVAESRGGETVYTLDGDQSPSAETVEALKVVISAHDPNTPSDDEIFGTRERKRVGDKWGINAAAAARDLSKKGLSVSAEDVGGGAQVNRVRTVDAVKVLDVSVHFRAEKLAIPLPQGMRLEKASLEADFTGIVPADPQSRLLLADEMRMRMTVQMSAQKPGTGEKITIESTMDATQENKYSPVQDARSRAGLEGRSFDRTVGPESAAR